MKPNSGNTQLVFFVLFPQKLCFVAEASGSTAAHAVVIALAMGEGGRCFDAIGCKSVSDCSAGCPV